MIRDEVETSMVDSQFLVSLVFPIDDEIRKYLSGCNIKINRQLSDEMIIIDGENLDKFRLRKIIYFRDVTELSKEY